MKLTLLDRLFCPTYCNIYQNLWKIVLLIKFHLVNQLANTTFFGIAIVSSKNRVFFRIFLPFESIHTISVRHSKIIHISKIRQRKILCFTSLFLSRCALFHSKFILPPKYFFLSVISLQSDESGFVLLP